LLHIFMIFLTSADAATDKRVLRIKK